jgi:hypothetical protein
VKEATLASGEVSLSVHLAQCVLDLVFVLGLKAEAQGPGNCFQRLYLLLDDQLVYRYNSARLLKGPYHDIIFN